MSSLLVNRPKQEELGIGRKDALPLEDKGYNGPIENLKPLKKSTNRGLQLTAAWRSKLTLYLGN
jgi:hypothetical protein